MVSAVEVALSWLSFSMVRRARFAPAPWRPKVQLTFSVACARGMRVDMSVVKPLPRVWDSIARRPPFASGEMPFSETLRRSSRKVRVRPSVAREMPLLQPWRFTLRPAAIRFALRRKSAGRVCWTPSIAL